MTRSHTLVLLPGLDGTGLFFESLMAALPLSLVPQVVRYPVDRALGYEALAALIAPQLPTDRPFVLLGESFAGPLALRLAAKVPPGLVALVLVATFHRRPASPALAMLRPFATTPVFALRMPGFVVRRLLAGVDASAEFVNAFQAGLSTVSPRVLAARAQAALTVDASEEARACRVPVLYLEAERDGLMRPALAEELRTLIPSLELQRLPVAHLVLQRLPRESAAAIEAFVARVHVAGVSGERHAAR